ncbi:uracil-DNA glycosylase family protein [Candidatus Stoquefichus massiliensis]|uniref:uracil-DNA glycosylase family protein n=1 Tax=Candidatus Stoquefichus massiliensis TaxID=1470350 RepID=UPI0004860E6B|nr:uracil-DNA glycosylase family protein [Candidatus Stoquefichus massiliensis]
MNIKSILGKMNTIKENLYFNDVEVIPENIKAILINEVVPSNPKDDFYGSQEAEYLASAVSLFQKAGIDVRTAKDILELGIYITNAVKTPKSDYSIEKSMIQESLPYLNKELALFPNIKVIMLMGDVSKKAMNMITKKESGKNAIPSISTYKLRKNEILYKGVRLMPSYIMTGKNILIEKSKFQMASEDIAIMYDIISN